jgi:hypothetical protein
MPNMNWTEERVINIADSPSLLLSQSFVAFCLWAKIRITTCVSQKCRCCPQKLMQRHRPFMRND